MLNLKPIYEDSLDSLENGAEVLQVKSLPISVFMMQKDVINHYRYAFEHYIDLTLKESFLQNSSLGSPYDPYSHKAIAGWSERFWNKYSDVDSPKDIERYMPLLVEIESEWDMYEAWYSERHAHAVEAAPLLPEHYFKTWLKQLNA